MYLRVGRTSADGVSAAGRCKADELRHLKSSGTYDCDRATFWYVTANAGTRSASRLLCAMHPSGCLLPEHLD